MPLQIIRGGARLPRPIVVVKLLMCDLNFDLHLVVRVFYNHIIWH